MEGRAHELSECGPTIDEIIAELMGVSDADAGVRGPRETVFVYGRAKPQQPTPHRSAGVWLIWQPWARRPRETMVTLIEGMFTATRDAGSPDHLLEIPLVHATVLGIEDFIMPRAWVEKIRQRIGEMRGF